MDTLTIYDKKEVLEKCPYFKPNTDKITACVIIPTGEIHDSGYGCMKFILASEDKVVGCVGGYSDVIRLNGIGGYGERYAVPPQKLERVDWVIDILPNGLFRLFTQSCYLSIDSIIGSDFSLYIRRREET